MAKSTVNEWRTYDELLCRAVVFTQMHRANEQEQKDVRDAIAIPANVAGWAKFDCWHHVKWLGLRKTREDWDD